MEKEAEEDYPAGPKGWQRANRGKKRGGWKRNKARNRHPDRGAPPPGPGGDGGGDEPVGDEGEEEEEEEEKEPPRR
eukprot:197940-Pyramimonas_sp.AAC.1